MDGRKTRWRSYGLALLLLLAFAGLILRLSTIQLNSTRIASTVQPSLVEGAEKQHTQEMIVESGRGSILDRRGKPLTGERGWRLIAFPFAKSHLLAHEEKLIRLARSRKGDSAYSPDLFLEEMELLIDQQMPETEASVESEATDSVKLMTIHQSKGLEFPVVIIPD
ncbi:MAG: hypothetical protein LOD87_01570, partial [Planifilum fulgidum]